MFLYDISAKVEVDRRTDSSENTAFFLSLVVRKFRTQYVTRADCQTAETVGVFQTRRPWIIHCCRFVNIFSNMFFIILPLTFIATEFPYFPNMYLISSQTTHVYAKRKDQPPLSE